MGKVKKNKNKISNRHNPLDIEILENRYAQSSFRNKTRSKQPKDDEFVDTKLTSEILKQARQQKNDIDGESNNFKSPAAPHISLNSIEDFEDLNLCTDEVEENDFEFPVDIAEEDKKALATFMSKDSEERLNLADVLKEKLTEKQTEIHSVYSDAGNVYEEDKAAFQYRELAPVLQGYRGRRAKLPKAFKTIPKFENWEHILCLTEPDKWSDAAMFEATRLFSSNLPDKMAQRFYNLFLFPRVRDEIADSKELSTHLYDALKKALFKPSAFFKGMIIPLCQSGNCTLREASIWSGILAKCSIPVLHSSAALIRIAGMEFSNVNSLFMRTLIEKKYALPYSVLNAVVDHFLRSDKAEQFPLCWHQCLLTFVEIYKTDLLPEQKKNLSKLLTLHFHEHVTPEIRKHLEEDVSGANVQRFFKM